ncbi:MAG: hypothetical protein ACR2PO_10555 [Methyloligellaceae bacterium]
MRTILACLLTVTFGALTAVSDANAASIVGAWSGGGTIKLASGGTEVVRCRVSYSQDTAKTYGIAAVCATTAGTISQSGRVVKVRGNNYSGRLYNKEYSVSGKIAISVRGSRQTLTVSSPKGSGRLTLNRR